MPDASQEPAWSLRDTPKGIRKASEGYPKGIACRFLLVPGRVQRTTSVSAGRAGSTDKSGPAIIQTKLLASLS